jgi:DNA (cytosine-5)-methyltransferase 1
MRHGSLFSGIGGFDLAAEWMGWENVFHCEWNPFGQRVLKHYWPNAELFTDITKSDFTKYANTIDILTGGFPCQPYSSAGKRLGKEDERHLWPEMLRVIREVAPRYVVGENVRGLTNWNGGLVFNEVCTDLENLGYQVAPFIIPASAVNAPHQRERVWFVAYARCINPRCANKSKWASNNATGCSCDENTRSSKINDGDATNANGNGLNQRDCEHEKHPSETGFDAFNDINENAMHTDNERLQGRAHEGNAGEKGEGKKQFTTRPIRPNWDIFPTQSPICGGDDGLPTELDGITFSKWRNESIKAYGNAIVPQVVYEIFKAIEKYENL